jgi:hypothetical protein
VGLGDGGTRDLETVIILGEAGVSEMIVLEEGLW